MTFGNYNVYDSTSTPSSSSIDTTDFGTLTINSGYLSFNNPFNPIAESSIFNPAAGSQINLGSSDLSLDISPFKDLGNLTIAIGFAPQIIISQYDLSRIMLYVGTGVQFSQLNSVNKINLSYGGITSILEGSWNDGNLTNPSVTVLPFTASVNNDTPIHSIVALPHFSTGIDFAITRSIHMRLGYQLSGMNSPYGYSPIDNKPFTINGTNEATYFTEGQENGLLNANIRITSYINHKIIMQFIALL